MAEHKHGSMDISAQEKTYQGFLAFSKWGIILSVLVLIFLALVNS